MVPNAIPHSLSLSQHQSISQPEAQLQDYLPFALLPILIITALAAPPFYGRGIIFASLIILTDYLSLVSPWPPNAGSTRPSRYGNASSWLLVLPVLEKLLLHVPEQDFWRINDLTDDAVHTSRGTKDNSSPSNHRQPAPPPPWTWRKLRWAGSLASTPRGVGWNFASHRVKNAYDAMRRKKISRFSFVRSSLARAFFSYLALDSVLVFGQDLSVPITWKANWITIRDILVAEFFMFVCTYASMTMQFESLAAISVGLGFSRPEPVLGFGNFIVQRLHITNKSPAASLIILTTAFGISNFFHIVCLAVIRDENLTLQSLITDMSLFFMTQPVAACMEALAIHIYSKCHPTHSNEHGESETITTRKMNGSGKQPHAASGGNPSPVLRAVGYLWVVTWFSVTGWGFTRAYIAVGVRDWQIPLSLWRALLDRNR
ncbi:hypothetical protein LTR84_009572 [Exophiala bonariae]|uniref:Wax synthase domain-containing protein n=1 Tax=Exophiala bonariae TaxID=1690606 RepID=A0AAV9NJT9_9EURO|nr:hypothetical protein LTR84_009572 [Exophiala bonariae]